MNLLTRSNPKGRDIVALPAGLLTYVGFAAYRLEAGERLPLDAADRELCVVLLTGHASVTGEALGQGAFGWENIGDRHSVFEDASPFAMYLPPHSQAHLTALGPAHVAVCSAPGDSAKPVPARLLTPDSMKRSVRGTGACTRYVCEILPDTELAHSLLVVEVRTPSGHCSSYPPHKHDLDNLPDESFLEKSCYHQVNPPQGFVFQRVYTEDRSLDQAMAVENHDLVAVPRGYHPVCVPYGYEACCLNVMAGPTRGRQARDDSQHSWLMDL
ncbi:5-deoxy-glucuronate isomerase [Pseudomonas sp. v388]|uniref:5-deoxy-glucuronate isomerase n=1 Tax=Pseudomonas sp. v388 TaxID=2479849 RepID=UPI000F7B04D8|nr:5-deoxy-glucuronate isomerase [Pseudomonas sp. v388]RRV05735.1 5-deoxy-glucuronate isomerase [Pseudomonas sp. v388]